LIHLLVTAGQTWRKRFSTSDVKFMLGKGEGQRLQSLVQDLQQHEGLLEAICRLGSLPPAKYPEEQWRVAKALFRVLSRALAELQLVFAERGECDYAELALAARTALTSEAEDGARALEAALGIRLQHLLVDEMQDTSSSQYELIQLLTAGWDGHSQTAFLVGDPKQSIYLFRQARVERFLRTMRVEHLGDLPLGCLRLTANFRSSAALVEDFNADFAAIFPVATDTLHPEDVPYVRATAARGASEINDVPQHNGRDVGWDIAANAPITPRIWHPSILPYEMTTLARQKQRQAHAAEIRNIVEQWRAKPLLPDRTEPWKIAVLVRNRSHLEEVVVAFKSAPGIPFRAVDIEPLRERPEVQDLIALTRALHHPADRVAWLAILRAPWCGFSLAELHLLAGGDDRAFAQRSLQQVIAERGDLLGPESCQRLERLWPILEAASAMQGRAPMSQIVERTWRALGGDAYCDAPEIANARRYLELLIEIEEEAGVLDIEILGRRLDRLFAAPIAHPNAVDLMTIHGAKGLEWDVVTVPALERLGGSNRNRLLTWLELDSADEDSAHFLLAPIAGRGEESRELNKWIASVHSARESAERKRLFYVACTRAREELHLFAAPSLTSKGEVAVKAASLLHAAWPAAKPVFSAAATRVQLEDSVVGETDDQPALEIAASGFPSTDPKASTSLGTTLDQAPGLTAPLLRLPIAFDPAARFVNPSPFRYGDREEAASAPHFERPEGSFAARAFGNAVHAFLEAITQQMAAGESAASILDALPSWAPRIAAVLRAQGLPPAAFERLVQRVLFALESTLKDASGAWLLTAHAGAASEYALTAWSEERSSVRIDRIFRAGAEPLARGSDHLWIVDYKTTTHGAEGLDAFLIAEKEKYAPQLEAYARIFASESSGLGGIRVALYYPMLARLLSWRFL
jgi:ATP-dependent exoDNAse (exonuclease V) beta subunit